MKHDSRSSHSFQFDSIRQRKVRERFIAAGRNAKEFCPFAVMNLEKWRVVEAVMPVTECQGRAVTVVPVDRLDHFVHAGRRRGALCGLSPVSRLILRASIATCAVVLAQSGAAQQARLSASQDSPKAVVALLEAAEQPGARPVAVSPVDRRIAQAFAVSASRPHVERGLVAVDVADSPIFSLRIVLSKPHAESERSPAPAPAPVPAARYAASDPRLPFTYILREPLGALDGPNAPIADYLAAFAPPEGLPSRAISPFDDAPKLMTGTAVPVPTGRPERDASKTAATSPEPDRAAAPAKVAPPARRVKGPASPADRPRDVKTQARQASNPRSVAPAVAEPAARRKKAQPQAEVPPTLKLPDSLLPTRPPAN